MGQRDTLSVVVVDEKLEPIAGVDIIRSDYMLRFGHTNYMGSTVIVVDSSDQSYGFRIRCLGYEDQLLTYEELKQIDRIKLKPSLLEIDEVVVVGHTSIEKLMKELRKKHKYRKRVDGYQHYGMVHLGKVVESEGVALCKKQEYGLFLTNLQFSFDYELNYLPIYIANSFDLAYDRKSVVSPIQSLSDTIEERFHTQFFKLFSILRSIFDYGPILGNTKKFDFKIYGHCDSITTIIFKTHLRSKEKNKGDIQGTIDVDFKRQEILSMTFTNFDFGYYLWNYAFNQYSPDMIPHNKLEIKVDFNYTDHKEIYVERCESSMYWYRSPSQKHSSVYPPARTSPGEKKLIEKEYFYVEEYKEIPLLLRSHSYIANAKGGYTIGEYNPSFFKKNMVFDLKSTDNFRELKKFMPLELQYKQSNNRIDRGLVCDDPSQHAWKYLIRLTEIGNFYLETFDLIPCTE